MMSSRCQTPMGSTMYAPGQSSGLKLNRRFNQSEINVQPSVVQRGRIQEFEKLRVTHNKSQQQTKRPKFAGQRDVLNFNDRIDSPESPEKKQKLQNFDEVTLNIE
jgi:hypothetical protein